MGVLSNICSPALIYLVFSLTQITIDIFKQANNTAFFKFIVMIIFTTLLNVLCSKGLGIISWIIVFVPFMLMSFITTILLVVFGLDKNSGKVHQYKKPYNDDENHYRHKGEKRKHEKKYDNHYGPVNHNHHNKHKHHKDHPHHDKHKDRRHHDKHNDNHPHHKHSGKHPHHNKPPPPMTTSVENFSYNSQK